MRSTFCPSTRTSIVYLSRTARFPCASNCVNDATQKNLFTNDRTPHTEEQLMGRHTCQTASRVPRSALPTSPMISCEIFVVNPTPKKLTRQTYICALRCSQTLTSLDLRENNLGADGARQLAEALRVNQVTEFNDMFIICTLWAVQRRSHHWSCVTTISVLMEPDNSLKH
jgi:hypothetical protein